MYDDNQPLLRNIPTGAKLRALAFALLAKREYSKTDLEKKLLNYQANPEEVTTLLEELRQSNYQNDERMAGMLIRSQIRQGKGPARIKQALKKHDIEQDLADDELADIDWFQQAFELKVKKFGEKIAKEQKLKAKQIRFLQYRGFSMDVIMKVINYKETEE